MYRFHNFSNLVITFYSDSVSITGLFESHLELPRIAHAFQPVEFFALSSVPAFPQPPSVQSQGTNLCSYQFSVAFSLKQCVPSFVRTSLKTIPEGTLGELSTSDFSRLRVLLETRFATCTRLPRGCYGISRRVTWVLASGSVSLADWKRRFLVLLCIIVCRDL